MAICLRFSGDLPANIGLIEDWKSCIQSPTVAFLPSGMVGLQLGERSLDGPLVLVQGEVPLCERRAQTQPANARKLGAQRGLKLGTVLQCGVRVDGVAHHILTVSQREVLYYVRHTDLV